MEPKRYTGKIKRWIRQNPEKWRKELGYLWRFNAYRTELSFEMNRTYKAHYEPVFSQHLSQFFGYKKVIPFANLVRTLTKGKTLTVLEDGAGKGNFLGTLSEEMKRQKIPLHSTALALTPEPELDKLKHEGKIDSVIYGRAELFTPKKKYNLIVSMFGSLIYVPQELRALQFMKYANSLEKGGVMLVGFSAAKILFKNPQKELAQIIRTLTKHGFKAQVFQNTEDYSFREDGFVGGYYTRKTGGTPQYTLIVQKQP